MTSDDEKQSEASHWSRSRSSTVSGKCEKDSTHSSNTGDLITCLPGAEGLQRDMKRVERLKPPSQPVELTTNKNGEATNSTSYMKRGSIRHAPPILMRPASAKEDDSRTRELKTILPNLVNSREVKTSFPTRHLNLHAQRTSILERSDHVSGHEEKSKLDDEVRQRILFKRNQINKRIQEEAYQACEPESGTAHSPIKHTETSRELPNEENEGEVLQTVGVALTPDKTLIQKSEGVNESKPMPKSQENITDRFSSLKLKRSSMRAQRRVSPARLNGALSLRGPEVHFVGELEGGIGFRNRAISCKWMVTYGSNWSILGGNEHGQSQYSNVISDDISLWNHPLDMHFATSSLQGWPRIEVQVWELDQYGRTLSAGYGFSHLPINPGHHSVTISCWRPTGGLLDEMRAFFLDIVPQLRDEMPIFGRAWEDRKRLTTIPCGEVKLSLYVATRFFSQHSTI